MGENETLEERLRRIDAYSYRKSLEEKIRKALADNRKDTDLLIDGVATICKDRHLIENVGEHIDRLNRAIVKNEIEAGIMESMLYKLI